MHLVLLHCVLLHCVPMHCELLHCVLPHNCHHGVLPHSMRADADSCHAVKDQG